MSLVTALILLQLLTRLLTFALNQTLVRIAPPEVFGTAAIQFDLVCSTILFLSREGIRNALLRSAPDALATLPFWAGQGVAASVLAIYLARLPLATSSQPGFYPALSLYVSGALVELAIEPHYISALLANPPRLRVRVQAEGGMAIVRAMVTVGCMWMSGQPLLAFAIGYAAGSVWLAARYIYSFGFGGLIWRSGALQSPRLSLALANTRQSLIKHVLTEADRIAVGAIYPLVEQGGYAVAINYGACKSSSLIPGSLIARILFQPIEETLFLHFSSSPASTTPASLALAVRLSLHLALIIPAFLPPLLPAILPLLLPSRYLATSAPAVLETYLVAYIPLMSLNGILEAFHTATATPAQISRQARWMVLSSLAFGAALWVQARSEYRETGLVWASCAAMAVRIVYAYRHAALSIMAVLPSWQGILAVALSRGVLGRVAASGRAEHWKGRVELVGVGAVCGLATLLVIGLVERRRWYA